MKTNALHILDDSPWFEWIDLETTESTNHFLKHYRPVSPKDMTLVTTRYQTAGRGQTGNTWESEKGLNLLFSLLIHPREVEANRQFILSQAIALAICEALSEYAEGFCIKWPNDIYWKDKKICGILIENTLTGKNIENCIIGVGVNINQQKFESNAPNPVSLSQITGDSHEQVFILAAIVKRFKDYYQQIRSKQTNELVIKYMNALYRKDGFHSYADANGTFEAEIRDIEPDGHLILADTAGQTRRYAFKEVRFLIPSADSFIAL